jgi:hypothetical protein
VNDGSDNFGRCINVTIDFVDTPIFGETKIPAEIVLKCKIAN